jgi:hypothetical protein
MPRPVFTLDPAEAAEFWIAQPEPVKAPDPNFAHWVPEHTRDWVNRTEAMFERQRQQRRARRMAFFNVQQQPA